MLLEKLPAEVQKDLTQRLASQEALEEPLRPFGRKQGRHLALRPDDATRSLGHEVWHEAIVECRRHLRGFTRVDEHKRVALELCCNRRLKIKVAKRDLLIGQHKAGGIRPAGSIQPTRFGMTVEIQDLIFGRVARQRLHQLCDRGACSKTDAFARRLCVAQKVSAAPHSRHPIAGRFPRFKFTLTERSGLSLGIAQSEMASVFCSGICSITWRIPRKLSQSSCAPVDASPM